MRLGLMSSFFRVVLAVLPAQAGALTFTRPAAWVDRAPASSMRVAEFVVPKASGDTEDGELIVYYFGGTGGTVEANLQRWASQFQSGTDPIRSTATVNGLRLTNLDSAALTSPKFARAPSHNKPGFRSCGSRQTQWTASVAAAEREAGAGSASRMSAANGSHGAERLWGFPRATVFSREVAGEAPIDRT